MDLLEPRDGERWTDNSLTLRIPSGWFFKESYTLLAEDGQANVIASTEPLDSAMTSLEYQQVQGNLLLTEFPGYVEHSLEEVGLPGLQQTAYLRVFSWAPPDGVPITQIQLYAAVPGRGITATATTPSSLFAERRETLLQAISSLEVLPDNLRAFTDGTRR